MLKFCRRQISEKAGRMLAPPEKNPMEPAKNNLPIACPFAPWPRRSSIIELRLCAFAASCQETKLLKQLIKLFLCGSYATNLSASNQELDNVKQQKSNILIIGNGIREHILAWKLSQSPWRKELYSLLGSQEMKAYCHSSDIELTDYPALIKFIRQHDINMVFYPLHIYNEQLMDLLRQDNRILFPQWQEPHFMNRSALRELCHHYAVPVPAGYMFDNYDGAHTYARRSSFPLVVKTDGISLSKTVICRDMPELNNFLAKAIKEKIYGEDGTRVWVEKYIKGPLISVAALVEGKNILLLPHCRHVDTSESLPQLESAYISARTIEKKIWQTIERHIVVPVVHALNRQLTDYRGILVFQIVTGNKGPIVVDLKMQCDDLLSLLFLTALKSDWLTLIKSLLAGELPMVSLDWENNSSRLGLVFSNSSEPGEANLGNLLTSLPTTTHTNIFHGNKRSSPQFRLGISTSATNPKSACQSLCHLLSQSCQSTDAAIIRDLRTLENLLPDVDIGSIIKGKK